MVDNKLGIDRQLDSFRAVRRDIEASVLPLATSLDGRRFTFQASLYALQLQVGGYAVLDDGAAPRARPGPRARDSTSSRARN